MVVLQNPINGFDSYQVPHLAKFPKTSIQPLSILLRKAGIFYCHPTIKTSSDCPYDIQSETEKAFQNLPPSGVYHLYWLFSEV